MTNQFDWQTEAESEWVEEPGHTVRNTAVSHWFSWRLGLLILLLLIGAGMVIRWQVNQRVETAANNVKAEVIAAHNLLRQTAANEDAELFKIMLSGRDDDWVDAQVELVDEGLFEERPFFNWSTEEMAPLTADDVTMTLSPDLQAAELQTEQVYEVVSGEGVSETIRLRQTAVYRRGSRRWLYSPPEPDFWGEWRQESGAFVTLAYPARDEAVATQLLADLDRLVVRVCQELEDVFCSADLRLHIRLDNDPASLLAAADVLAVMQSGLRLDLPAPTLVGVPVDEVAYRALFRGYGKLMVRSLLAELVGYDCCINGLFFQALQDVQLAQLGLKPQPLLTPADYDWFLDNSFAGSVSLEWSLRQDGRTGEIRRVYALIDYLQTEAAPGVSIARMQRALNQTAALPAWLGILLPQGYSAAGFEAAFFQFVFKQSSSGQLSRPPIPFPDGSVELVCDNNVNGPSSGVYRYNPRQQSWSTVFVYEVEGGGNSYSYIRWLGQEADLYFLQESRFDLAQNSRRTSFVDVKTGEQTPIFDFVSDPENGGEGIFVSGTDPSGDYLILYKYEPDGEWFEIAIAERSTCDDNQCRQQSVPGWPLWSPDGTHILMASAQAAAGSSEETEANNDPLADWRQPLFLADATGQNPVEIGQGGQPSWLNDETYTYVRVVNGEMELVTANTSANRPHSIVDSQALLALLPASERPEQLFLNYAVRSPADPRRLILTTATAALGQARRSLYYWEITLDETLRRAEEITLVYEVEEAPNENISLTQSPNGRWLSLLQYSQPDRRTVILLDRQTGAETSFEMEGFEIAWSDDGNWLAYAGENQFVLRAPAYDYRHMALNTFGNCYQAHWVPDS